jgi:hypothetical protein
LRYFFFAFLPFVGVHQDLERVLGTVRCSIDVRDADIDDTISTAGPQSADENVPSVFASVLVRVARNWEVWCFRVLLRGRSESRESSVNRE